MGPTAAVTEPTAARLMKVADDTREGGDLATAVTLYRRAHELSPNDPLPLTRLADALARERSYSEAVEVYRIAVGMAPGDWEIRRGFGNALIALGQPEAALVQLDAAQAKHPGDPRVMNAMGVAQDLSGRHDLAQRAYAQGLQAAPNYPTLRNNLGLSLALAGDYDKAARVLNALATETGATPRNRLNLALVLGLAGQRDASAEAARNDLDEDAIQQNLSYYAMLRAMDDRSRTAAILGVPLSRSGATAVASPTIAETPEVPARLSAAKVEVEELTEIAPRPVAAPLAPAAMPVTIMPATVTPKEIEAETLSPVSRPVTLVAKEADPVIEPVVLPQPAPVKVAAVSAPAEPPRPAAVETAPQGPIVQVGSFAGEENAKKLEKQLTAKGYNVAILKVTRRDGLTWYAVRAVGFASDEEAAEAARKLRTEGQPTAAVMHFQAAAATKMAVE